MEQVTGPQSHRVNQGEAAQVRHLRGWRLVLSAAGLLATAACNKATGTPSAPPVPQAGVISITTQNIPDEPEFIGQTESSRPVEIRSQVTGIIRERFFQEGREVKKGDHLYQIDPVPFQAAQMTAKAAVDQAQARLVQAQQNFDRVRPLLSQQAVSQMDLDNAIAEKLAAEAALASAKGLLLRAQFDLDNTLITAPISGLIERTRVYEGRLVSAQTDLLTIIDQVDPIFVTISVPERILLARRKGVESKKIRSDRGVLRAVITLVDGTIYPHEGTLEFNDVVYRVDTGSRQGRFVFPNPQRILLPGQFVKIRVKGETRADAILVPQRAVQEGPKGPIVYVLGPGDKVEVRDVKAGPWVGNQWLIETGLNSGDRVVVEGIQNLQPGAIAKAVPIDHSLGTKQEEVR